MYDRQATTAVSAAVILISELKNTVENVAVWWNKY